MQSSRAVSDLSMNSTVHRGEQKNIIIISFFPGATDSSNQSQENVPSRDEDWCLEEVEGSLSPP